jgi:hypothetical protein
MLQNRSQTKIRKMQELNLLAEQRHFTSKKILNENPEDILGCVATAANLTVADLIKLAPCLELQQNPTDPTKIQPCLTVVIPMAQEKLSIDIYDPIGSGKKIADLVTRIMTCAGETYGKPTEIIQKN